MLSEITNLLIENIQNPFITSFILGALPVSEVRGAVIYAVSINQPVVIIPAIMSNILISPLILLFWDYLNIPKIGRFILGSKLEKRLLEFGKKYEAQGLIALILYIGIPLPLTGVYTATLLAELLGIKREKILVSSIIGVLLAAIITFILFGGLSLIFRY